MGDPAVADRKDNPGSDQGIYHRVAHYRLPWLSRIHWSPPAKVPFIDHSNEVWNSAS
jgi:hypothetical protein